MKRISSIFTKFYKRPLPVFFLGLVLLVIGGAIADGAVRENPARIFLPLGVLIGGFLVIRRMLWDLVDEVYDCGDTLMIRNAGETYTVRLDEIANVDQTMWMNPPRVTLKLGTERAEGSEISFIPVTGFRLYRFARIPAIEDLVARVDRARLNA